jgi:pyruvate, water dikinase
MTALNTLAKYRFPAPLEVPAPPGAEGWQEMYSPYLLFSEENASWEASQFWYWDGMHRPDVEYPFDTVVHEAYMMSVAAVVSRLFSVPGAKSAASRVLNGRLYLADIPFDDPSQEERRIEGFMRRGGHYFEHWPELSDRWVAKVEALTAELDALEVPELPELEDESVVLEGRGVNSGHRLLDEFVRAIQNLFLVYQYHFEMLVLAYVAQMTFQELARDSFPGITEQTMAKLTAGVQLRQFQPDDELKRLARLAIDLGVADRVRTASDPGPAIAELARDPGSAGAEWVSALESAKDPWFHVSTGTGLFHTERAWIDDLSVPWAAIAGYINRLERGERIDRPQDELLAERDRLTADYRELLPSDAHRAAFDQSIGLSRTVAPHLQDHNYLIEHRHHTIFWNKIRQFADRVVSADLLDEQEDFFYLNRWEVGQVLFDAVNAWAQASPGLGRRWRATVARRREIVEALRDWTPEPAVGATPTALGGLLTAQFGITMETVETWLQADADEGDELQGVGASAGVAEGPARVVLRTSDIERVQDGEILVCPATAPAWAPVFGRVRGIVSDVGGMMSHAAILCREYGIPAVLGTSSGTRRIATGDLVRVDGDRGTVQLLGQSPRAD